MNLNLVCSTLAKEVEAFYRQLTFGIEILVKNYLKPLRTVFMIIRLRSEPSVINS